MNTLLVGFDSAWTSKNTGGLVAVLRLDNGTFREIGLPHIVDYREAETVIRLWQAEHVPAATIILLDQPTIVNNASGQRPVENIAASAVSLRYGGMQPANRGRAEMFGANAPVWSFLDRFGGAADPFAAVEATSVFETYPVLAMIALEWMLPDARPAGRLPKYNPDRRSTFSVDDWKHVCDLASDAYSRRGLLEIVHWLNGAAAIARPHKRDQDALDACLCLLVALELVEGRDCLMVGDLDTGYIVVPGSATLHAELEARCNQTGRRPSDWVRTFRLAPSAR